MWDSQNSQIFKNTYVCLTHLVWILSIKKSPSLFPIIKFKPLSLLIMYGTKFPLERNLVKSLTKGVFDFFQKVLDV